jgi:hypothetical protein
MGDLNFPEDCKKTLTEALARKAQKYHLLPSVKTACDGDVKQYCNQSAAAMASDPLLARLAFYNAPGGGDGQGDSQAAPTSNERKQDQELLCLSVHLGSLSNSCRQEMAMEIHQQLLVYMPGMPLTAACDEDAKKLCDAGEAGVAAALAVLAAKLPWLASGSALVWYASLADCLSSALEALVCCQLYKEASPHSSHVRLSCQQNSCRHNCRHVRPS